MRTFWRQISDAWHLNVGNKIILSLLAIGILMIGCTICADPGIIARSMVLETPIPRVAPGAPSGTLTYRQIEDRFNALTDLQREQYLPTLVGQSVHWRGKVNNVESDGSLDLDVGQRGAFYNVALIGVPKELSLQYNRGDSVIFDATITKAVRAVGFDMTLKYTSIVKE